MDLERSIMLALAFLRQRWSEDERIPMVAFIAGMRLALAWSKREAKPKDRAALHEEFKRTMKYTGF